MSNKNPDKKINIYIPLCIVFSVLYIVFAISKLPKELAFVPVWTVDASKADEIDENQELNFDELSPISFNLAQNIGYFSEEGKILSLRSFPFRSTVTENSYCIYGPNDKEMQILDHKGKQTGVIKASGFPFFKEDNKFLFLPGGTSFSKLDDEGNILWTYEGYAPITAFSSSKGGIIAGTSDGSIIIFDKDGKIRQNFIPGGSEFPVILGCDISEDGNKIAALTGQNRQRFIISEEKNGHWEIVFHKHLSKSVRNQTLVKFDERSNVVYYDFADGLGIVNTKTLKDGSIPMKGQTITISDSKDNSLVYILSKEKTTDDVVSKNVFTVTVLEPFDSIAGSFSFKANDAFLRVKDEKLFIGRDSKISRIDVLKN